MQAGKMDRKISFRSNTPTSDTYGEMIESWTTEFTTMAQKLSHGCKEFFAAQKKNAEVSAVYRMRYSHKTLPTVVMQLVDSSTYYDIVEIDDTLKRENVLIITCKDVT